MQRYLVSFSPRNQIIVWAENIEEVWDKYGWAAIRIEEVEGF